MRRVGAQDERGLEQDLVHLAGARLVVRDPIPLIPLGVLVAEPEAEELRGHEGHVRTGRPDGSRRILRVTQTPTFFVNGVKIDGMWAAQFFDQAIAFELKRSQ